jgi:uncharacterized protein with von Willebrand factor type A (vWA) domain
MGALAANLLHFARLLRAAGLPIGPERVLVALRTAQAVGVAERADFYWALHAVFVSREAEHDLFDEAFRLFWRNPLGLQAALAALLPKVQGRAPPQVSRRMAEALHGHRRSGEPRPREETVLDATWTYSDAEILRTKDFEAMSAEEIRRAKAIVARMELHARAVPTRRLGPDPRGAVVDLRATFRASLRAGGRGIPLCWRAPRTRPPAIVALCDISGSMSRYSEMLLHFLHALTGDRERVHSFTFGTRLTNITRHLRHRDVEVALGRLGRAVQDWSGGTRIGASLHEFNVRWSRRVLSQGAVVLLITDGLDRDGGEGLALEMERLHKSCRRLIWLNPLLRFEGFEPRAQGVVSMLPHVDDFRPAHDLGSLEDLAKALR